MRTNGVTATGGRGELAAAMMGGEALAALVPTMSDDELMLRALQRWRQTQRDPRIAGQKKHRWKVNRMLTPREMIFVDVFLRTKNPTTAAEAAGISEAQAMGYRWLNRPAIAWAIRNALEREALAKGALGPAELLQQCYGVMKRGRPSEVLRAIALAARLQGLMGSEGSKKGPGRPPGRGPTPGKASGVSASAYAELVETLRAHSSGFGAKERAAWTAQLEADLALITQALGMLRAPV